MLPETSRRCSNIRYHKVSTQDPWEEANHVAPKKPAKPKKKTSWKERARVIIPHVGLILLTVLYVLGGAFAFYHLERPNEVTIRKKNFKLIKDHQQLMLADMWRLVNDWSVSKDEVEEKAQYYVDGATKLLFQAFDTEFITANHLNKPIDDRYLTWTLTNAFFFTTTLLTSIGYGNMVPITPKGRMFCIIYAMFGVPLMLITVADIGKFFSENLIKTYTKYSEAKKRRKNRKLSRISNTETDDEKQIRNELTQLGLEDTSIPVPLIMGIMLGYIAFGAAILCAWEKWDFFSGFYFSFITLTTIGFGDIVPVKQGLFLVYLLYIVVGLAITTMCVDFFGIQYIRKLHNFGRAIHDVRFVLGNVGGKMAHVPVFMRYASFFHHQRLSQRGAQSIYQEGAYMPSEVRRLRYIDASSAASLDESARSICSSIFLSKSPQPVAV